MVIYADAVAQEAASDIWRFVHQLFQTMGLRHGYGGARNVSPRSGWANDRHRSLKHVCRHLQQLQQLFGGPSHNRSP